MSIPYCYATFKGKHADAGDKVPDIFSVCPEEDTKMTNAQFFFAVILAVLDALHELELLILTGATAADLLKHIKATEKELRARLANNP